MATTPGPSGVDHAKPSGKLRFQGRMSVALVLGAPAEPLAASLVSASFLRPDSLTRGSPFSLHRSMDYMRYENIG